jgi:hypothetical protein
VIIYVVGYIILYERRYVPKDINIRTLWLPQIPKRNNFFLSPLYDFIVKKLLLSTLGSAVQISGWHCGPCPRE